MDKTSGTEPCRLQYAPLSTTPQLAHVNCNATLSHDIRMFNLHWCLSKNIGWAAASLVLRRHPLTMTREQSQPNPRPSHPLSTKPAAVSLIRQLGLRMWGQVSRGGCRVLQKSLARNLLQKPIRTQTESFDGNGLFQRTASSTASGLTVPATRAEGARERRSP